MEYVYEAISLENIDDAIPVITEYKHRLEEIAKKKASVIEMSETTLTKCLTSEKFCNLFDPTNLISEVEKGNLGIVLSLKLIRNNEIPFNRFSLKA